MFLFCSVGQVGQQRLHVVVSGKLLRPGEQLMIVFSLLVY